MFDLKRKMREIANLDYKMTIKEWKKVIGKTLGINIMEDYYSGDFYKEMIEKWISDNVDLIKTVPSDSLGKVKQLVYENFMGGKTNTDIIKELHRQYGMDKRHARLIARDQTGKLNAQITRHQQKDAGVNEYIWRTCQDERVRESHKELHGKKFSWDNPPDVGRGRRAIQERTISADAEQSLYLMYLKLTLMFRFRFNGIRKAWRGGERSEENQN